MPALAPVLSPSEPEVDPLAPPAPVCSGPAPEPDGEGPPAGGNVSVVSDEAVAGGETVGDDRGVVVGVVFEPCHSQHLTTNFYRSSRSLETHSAADDLDERGKI